MAGERKSRSILLLILAASAILRMLLCAQGGQYFFGDENRFDRAVRLYQAVTLGAKRFPIDDRGALIKGIDRHPIVEDDVVIYAGATVLGRITIGRGSTIGGNVWLTESVPPLSMVTQARVRSSEQEESPI